MSPLILLDPVSAKAYCTRAKLQNLPVLRLHQDKL